MKPLFALILGMGLTTHASTKKIGEVDKSFKLMDGSPKNSLAAVPLNGALLQLK